MIFRKLGILAIIVLGLFVVFSLGAEETGLKNQGAQNAAGKDDITWYKYDEGLKLAAKAGKPILVDFYTDWCGWCKKMDKTTYVDPAVTSYVKTKFVAVKVNAESRDAINLPSGAVDGRKLARSFGVSGFPTTILLDSRGKAVLAFAGYRPADDFIHYAKYVGDGIYKSQTFKDYYAKATGGN
jgi:thioredoxin-related protein